MTTVQLKRIARFAYGDALAADARRDGEVLVFGSNGDIGRHDSSNTLGPVVIVGRKGSYGKVQYSPEPVFAIDTTYFIDSSQASEDLRWLYYLLLATDLSASSLDTGVPGLNREDAYRRRVHWVPRDMQRLIADFLDRETQRIDALINAKRRMIDLLEEKRRAAIDHAMHGDGTWPRVALQHLVDPRRPITYGIVLPGPNVDRGVPIIKSGDVKPGRLHPDRLDRTTVEIESRYLRSRVRPGDIVYSIRGSVGTVEIVPESLPVANLTQDTARVAPAGHVSRDWLLFALRSSIAFSELEAGMTGAAVKGINIFSLNKLRLQVPPLAIQRSIAAELTEVTSRIDAAERAVAIQLALLTEYRQALITKAVTGQLDEATLKGKKPADEGVSV